ncbi:hypothetical protein [Pseudodesulfovibrio sp. S3]|uniref:hypothetical protein n=1 Tax=Pseudodesulfovibrio sp. S3 TaxID=2283629 RepID=UPI0019D4293A|nr:hypothetical protein [Pseudodesulfovibrio sp. S3]MCJ2163533.1 hypothetical protein [Pseudodesulfovibrio sp. S3-i]
MLMKEPSRKKPKSIKVLFLVNSKEKSWEKQASKTVRIKPLLNCSCCHNRPNHAALSALFREGKFRTELDRGTEFEQGGQTGTEAAMGRKVDSECKDFDFHYQ